MGLTFTAANNPATQLYEVWLLLLSMRGSLSMQTASSHVAIANAPHSYNGHAVMSSYPRMYYGSRGYQLAVMGFDYQSRPVLAFGSGWGMDFILGADGRFMLTGFWGWKQRTHVARNTFLGFGHVAGSYRWFFDPLCDGPMDGWAYRADGIRDLTDHLNPIPYINERIIDRKYTWLELAPDNGSYRIVPSSNQAPQGMAPSETAIWHVAARYPTPPGLDAPDLRLQFERDDLLRTRRYLRYENKKRVAQGLAKVKLSGPRSTVMSGTTPIPLQDAVTQIMALMKVSEPATITPLKREAQGGPDVDRMVTNDPTGTPHVAADLR